MFSIIFRQRVGNEADAPFGETYAVSGAPQTLFSNQNSDVDADLSDSLLGNYTELKVGGCPAPSGWHSAPTFMIASFHRFVD